MVPMTRSLLPALLLAASLHAPSAAQSPKITLRLQNVTASEAVDALSKEAVVPIQIELPPQEGEKKPPEVAKLEERSTFEWKQVSLARALRELCARYQLEVRQRWQGAYRLGLAQPLPPPDKPAKLVGLVEKQGMRLWATGVQVSSHRSLNFFGGPGNVDRNENTNLTLTLSCNVGEEDVGKIASIENVTAKDDRGALLLSTGGWRGRGGMGGATADTWTGMVSLSGPHPKATKLAWVEGEVLAYRIYRPFHIELPLTGSEKPARKRTPEATVEVVQFDAHPPDAAGGNGNGGPLLKANLFLPADSGASLQSDGGTNAGPFLVGRSGKLYAPAGIGSGGRGDEQGMQYDLTCNFAPIDEPVVKVIFPLVIQQDPQPLFQFRMTNIPLPLPSAFAAPPLPMRPSPRKEPPAPEKTGATLVSQVLVEKSPAGEGTLSVGLARKSGDGWSAVRWQDVPVAKDGLARLEGVQPGAYRLLRIYRPKEGPKGIGEGGWQNSECIVEIVADKEMTAPPLQWTLDPPAKPKSAPRGGRLPARKSPVRNHR